jgi:hypothetical protein
MPPSSYPDPPLPVSKICFCPMDGRQGFSCPPELLYYIPTPFDTICLQPVTMPACTSLTYDSNDLDPLQVFPSSSTC